MYLNLQPRCLGMGDVPLDECIRLATLHGFGGIDVPTEGILSPRDAEAAAEALDAAHLQRGLFWMPCDVSSADEDAFDAALLRLRALAPLVHAVGTRRTYAHIWPSSDRPYDANMRWHVDRIRRVLDVLAPLGILFGVEFLGPHHLRRAKPHPFIHTLDGALELIARVGDGAGLVLDTFHHHCSGGRVDELPAKLAGVTLVNVHLNDAMPGRALEDQLDHERGLPLEHGVIDSRAVLGVLRRLDYDGPVIVEPFTPWTSRFSGMPRDAVAAQVSALVRPLM